MTRMIFIPALFALAAITQSNPAQAGSVAETTAWLKQAKAKVDSREPTEDLVAKARSVSFDGSPAGAVSAQDLAKLAVMPNLVDVGLGNKSGSDEGVAVLVKTVPNLRTLAIHYSSITDKALESLSALKQLEDLKVFKTKITAEGMKSVAKITSLKRLDVSDTAIGDAGLEAIQALPLQSFWFNSMKGVTRKGMAAIAALPSLTNLVIQFAEIDA